MGQLTNKGGFNMTTGLLYARVFAGQNEAVPVTNALVRVILQNGDVREFVTDASGHTEPTTIDAPESALSLIPCYDGPVYATCDVEVFALGFRPVRVTGVQVFAGQTAVLPVEMEPAAVLRGDTQDGWVFYNIPENNINDRTERNLDPPEEGISPNILDSVVMDNANIFSWAGIETTVSDAIYKGTSIASSIEKKIKALNTAINKTVTAIEAVGE